MLFYLILGALIFSAYKLYSFIKCPKELENIPAVPLHYFFAFTLSKLFFREKMDEYFQPYFDEYGVIRVLTHLGWAVFISDAKIAKEISINSDIFIKPDIEKAKFSHNFLRFFGQRNVAIMNFEDWKRQRKIINPIFNQTWKTELFGSCAQDLIDEWEKVAGKEIKIHDKIQRMTLDVFGKSIFDIEFKSVKNSNHRLYKLYQDISEELFSRPIYILFSFLEYVPFFRRPHLSQKLDKYDEIINELIKAKKKELKEGKLSNKGDLISALIQSNENEQEYKMTMEEIRENLTGFVAAGHDTTSNTLTSTLYYLARYPEIQDKLRAQVLDAMEHPKKVQIPTIEQLRNMPFMDMVNKESMRIMTTAASLQRVTLSTYTLSSGLTISKDTNVFLHLWGIHHNPSAFPDPYEFKPERFEDISNEESKNWQPFLVGNRACPGSTFSLMEQRVTLSMLLQKFEFFITRDNSDYDNLRISSTGIVRPMDLSIGIKSRNSI